MTNKQPAASQPEPGEPVVKYLLAFQDGSVLDAYDTFEEADHFSDECDSVMQVIPVVAKAEFDQVVEQNNSTHAFYQERIPRLMDIGKEYGCLEQICNVLANGSISLHESSEMAKLQQQLSAMRAAKEQAEAANAVLIIALKSAASHVSGNASVQQMVSDAVSNHGSASAALLARLERLEAALMRIEKDGVGQTEIWELRSIAREALQESEE